MTNPQNAQPLVTPSPLHISVAGGDYPIMFGWDGLSSTPQVLVDTLRGRGDVLPRRVIVVTQQNIIDALGSAEAWAWAQAFEGVQAPVPEVTTVLVPDGEPAKQWACAAQVFATALSMKLSRKDLIVAYGGGVVGDLAGFCAALYNRGVPLLQVPTTLLAQVDSSVGGKVAVNFDHHKNMLGQFYQPAAVVADGHALCTLPEREWLAGLGEVAKYALLERTILDPDDLPPYNLMAWLSRHARTWREVAHLPWLVRACCHLKAVIVNRDEREDPTRGADGRMCLNLGHTFGHAIESRFGMEKAQRQADGWLHGEAVALGLLLAARFAAQKGLLSDVSLQQVTGFLSALGLPNCLPQACHDDIGPLIQAMAADKKNLSGNLRLLLPVEPLGTVALFETTLDDPHLSSVWQSVVDC